MFLNMVERIFSIFGYEISIVKKADAEKNLNSALKYGDTSKINFTSIFSQKLAFHSVSDSDFVISDDNKRAELLNDIGNGVWGKIKKITAMSLGTGGCVIVPYVKGGKLYYNYIAQDRLFIHEELGDAITGATIIAESTVIGTKRYLRLTDYKVTNNTLYIRNKAIDAQSGNVVNIPIWSDISDVVIQNVERVPFGYIKCPIDNRASSDSYGVPITYGCENTISKIYDCLNQIDKEYGNKRTRLQVDPRCFKKNDKTGEYEIKDDIFMAGPNTLNENIFNIFDPSIRDSSYYNRLHNLFAQLEKEVGTSRGILTEPLGTYENSNKIKEAVGATFAIVNDIRKAIETGVNDFLYACDVLANYYNLSPQGEYNASYDWDYSMIESSTEKWNQLKDGKSMGVISGAETRAWLTGENKEDAQKAIDEIKKTEPSLRTLIGE